jgi:flagellar P-ring protein precursor FlgI
MIRASLVLGCILALAAPTQAGARIKDITDLEGARSNQLYGFGVVVGLNGTGGRSRFTQQVAVSMLKWLCINSKIAMLQLTDNTFMSPNISAVMVTAEIGPFARIGSRIAVAYRAAHCCLRPSRARMASFTPSRKARSRSAASSSAARRPALRRISYPSPVSPAEGWSSTRRAAR